MMETLQQDGQAGATVMYLDLMKKALSYSLWREPGTPIGTSTTNTLRKSLARLVSGWLQRADLQLVRMSHRDPELASEGHYRSQQADTMIGLKRLGNIQFCVEQALAEGVQGDLIETGVWRGGSCIFMRAILAAYGVTDRRVFVADSFAGLPVPDTLSYPADSESFPFHELDYLAVSREEVAQNFAKYGLLDEQVVFLEGWFKDTLPRAPIERLAVMRLDGDLYQSTMESLVNLYPKLSPGGFCIIDDYSIGPCRQAVTDFRELKGIASPIVEVDWTGVYWQKGEGSD